MISTEAGSQTFGLPGAIIGAGIGIVSGILEDIFGGGPELPSGPVRWKLTHWGGDPHEWAQRNGIYPAWVASMHPLAGTRGLMSDLINDRLNEFSYGGNVTLGNTILGWDSRQGSYGEALVGPSVGFGATFRLTNPNVSPGPVINYYGFGGNIGVSIRPGNNYATGQPQTASVQLNFGASIGWPIGKEIPLP